MSPDPGTAELAAFAAACRARREKWQMSQAELAARSGVAASHLSMIEHCKANPTLGVMCAIADVLGLTLVEMLQPELTSKHP